MKENNKVSEEGEEDGVDVWDLLSGSVSNDSEEVSSNYKLPLNIDRISWDEAGKVFSTTYRLKQPFIITNLPWKSINDWKLENSNLYQQKNEILLLIAHDNTHFLKNDGTSHFNLPLNSILSKILINNDKNEKDEKKLLIERKMINNIKNFDIKEEDIGKKENLRLYARSPITDQIIGDILPLPFHLLDYERDNVIILPPIPIIIIDNNIDNININNLNLNDNKNIIAEEENNDNNNKNYQSIFKRELCSSWISSEGCITPLHYDLCHGFLSQIIGKKKVILFSPDDWRNLYPRSITSSCRNSSKISLDLWMNGDENQISRFPNVGNAKILEVILDEGEMLYIPPFFWHFVETINPSVSVLLPFDMNANEEIHPVEFRA